MKRNGGKIPRDCGYVNVSALEEGVDLLSTAAYSDQNRHCAQILKLENQKK